MTDKPTTVRGKVAKITEWQSGKGFFLNFEGDENDYYKFGPAKVEVGQTVAFECKPGSKIFSDKVELIKKVEAGTDTIDVNKLKQEVFKTADTVYLSKAEADAVRQNSIERQSAIKSACALVGAIHSKSKTDSWNDVANNVTDIADKFLDFIKMDEPKLPEPEEAD